MKNRHLFLIIVLTFLLFFTCKAFAQERNLVLRSVKVLSVSSQYGNSFSTVETLSGQRFYFWSKIDPRYTPTDPQYKDLMSEAMVLSNRNKVFDIYYYNDKNQLKWGQTWMYAYGIRYQDRQYYIETGERVR